MIILYVYRYIYTAMWIRRSCPGSRAWMLVVDATCYYDDVLEHKSFLRGHR